jgi:4-amino-4-deoxy-L-arabinose transferase-like glycosyltransferase
MTETVVDRASSSRAWIAVAVATLASLAVLTIWLLGTSTGNLREQLKTLQPWWLDACVLLGLIAGVCLLKTVERDVYRREIPRMAMLASLGVALTLFVAPRTNRIFYDEQIYQGIGQNLADARLAQVCNDGSVEYGRLRCASGEYNKQPYAYPHVLSLAYRLVGVHAWTAFGVNAAAMALTVCAVYLLVCVLFRDRDAALFAGLLIVLTPQQLLWSATAAVEPSASLALVVSLLCAAHYLRAGGWPALGAAVVAASYAIQFRPESILILLVIAFMTWPRLRPELARPGGWWAANLFLWLVAVHLAHLFAVRHIDWGTAGPRFSLRYIEANLRVNGWFYLYDERFPGTFTGLAVAGLLWVRRRREGLSMAMYFLAFFVVDLLFYAGSYNYGADVRYSVMTYPPMAVLGGLGAARLARAMAGLAARSTTWFRAAAAARPVIVTVLLFQFLWYAPIVRATTEEAWAARADVRFAQTFARALPRNSYVLTHNPAMFHVWGANAGQMSLVTSSPEYLRFLTQRYSGGLYLHWNFWCNVQDPARQEFCRRVLAAVPGEVAAEYRERDQRFAFYRVKVANE